MSRVVTKHICKVALDKIGGRSRPFYFYSLLRRVNARRQNEIADLMTACSDYSFSLLNLLIYASKATDFVREKRRMRGLSVAELTLIENVVPPLEAAFWKATKSYADDARALMVTDAYIRKILGNPEVVAYVRGVHPKVFRDLKRLGFNVVEEAVSTDAVMARSGI